jgi:DNA-binding IclR family transcriptional regulator
VNPAATSVTLPDLTRAARAAGYAIEIGETNEHAGCVAAPVLDGDGKVIAALSLAAPEQRLNSPDRMILVAAARRGAAGLAASLSACRDAKMTREVPVKSGRFFRS